VRGLDDMVEALEIEGLIVFAIQSKYWVLNGTDIHEQYDDLGFRNRFHTLEENGTLTLVL